MFPFAEDPEGAVAGGAVSFGFAVSPGGRAGAGRGHSSSVSTSSDGREFLGQRRWWRDDERGGADPDAELARWAVDEEEEDDEDATVEEDDGEEEAGAVEAVAPSADAVAGGAKPSAVEESAMSASERRRARLVESAAPIAEAVAGGPTSRAVEGSVISMSERTSSDGELSWEVVDAAEEDDAAEEEDAGRQSAAPIAEAVAGGATSDVERGVIDEEEDAMRFKNLFVLLRGGQGRGSFIMGEIAPIAASLQTAGARSTAGVGNRDAGPTL